MNITKFDDGSIFVNQYAYARKILARFNMDCANSISTPSHKSNVPDDEENKLIEKEIPYHQAVGSLMYLAIATRPYLSYAISTVSENLENPWSSDWYEVKLIVLRSGSEWINAVFQRGSLAIPRASRHQVMASRHTNNPPVKTAEQGGHKAKPQPRTSQSLISGLITFFPRTIVASSILKKTPAPGTTPHTYGRAETRSLRGQSRRNQRKMAATENDIVKPTTSYGEALSTH